MQFCWNKNCIWSRGFYVLEFRPHFYLVLCLLDMLLIFQPHQVEKNVLFWKGCFVAIQKGCFPRMGYHLWQLHTFSKCCMSSPAHESWRPQWIITGLRGWRVKDFFDEGTALLDFVCRTSTKKINTLVGEQSWSPYLVSKQWAAVRTQHGSMRLPPQRNDSWGPLLADWKIVAIQGWDSIVAFRPPTILKLLFILLWPHVGSGKQSKI